MHWLRPPQPSDVSRWFTLFGIAASFISTFFAHGFLSLAKKAINEGKAVSRTFLVSARECMPQQTAHCRVAEAAAAAVTEQAQGQRRRMQQALTALCREAARVLTARRCCCIARRAMPPGGQPGPQHQHQPGWHRHHTHWPRGIRCAAPCCCLGVITPFACFHLHCCGVACSTPLRAAACCCCLACHADVPLMRRRHAVLLHSQQSARWSPRPCWRPPTRPTPRLLPAVRSSPSTCSRCRCAWIERDCVRARRSRVRA